MLNKIRAIFRLLFVGLSIIWIVTKLIVYKALGILRDDNRFRLRAEWSRLAMWLAGFDITVKGEAPNGETILYVGNHRSTLDPLLAFVAIEASPVSKMWVQNFPLVGYGSELTGIIFIDKESRASRASTKERILQEMQKGNSILIYPEGHTHSLPYTKTFLKGSFDQAASGGFRVVPFVLEYRDTRDYWERDESIVGHFFNRFGKRKHYVHLEIGEPLASDNPWTLLRQSREWIDEKMCEIHSEWGNTHYDGLDPDELDRTNSDKPIR